MYTREIKAFILTGIILACGFSQVNGMDNKLPPRCTGPEDCSTYQYCDKATTSRCNSCKELCIYSNADHVTSSCRKYCNAYYNEVLGKTTIGPILTSITPTSTASANTMETEYILLSVAGVLVAVLIVIAIVLISLHYRKCCFKDQQKIPLQADGPVNRNQHEDDQVEMQIINEVNGNQQEGEQLELPLIKGENGGLVREETQGGPVITQDTGGHQLAELAVNTGFRPTNV